MCNKSSTFGGLKKLSIYWPVPEIFARTSRHFFQCGFPSAARLSPAAKFTGPSRVISPYNLNLCRRSINAYKNFWIEYSSYYKLQFKFILYHPYWNQRKIIITCNLRAFSLSAVEESAKDSTPSSFGLVLSIAKASSALLERWPCLPLLPAISNVNTEVMFTSIKFQNH